MKEPVYQIGDSLIVQRKIVQADAAQKEGEGSLTQLLGTPNLIDMMIDTAIQLVDSNLDEGFISVGKAISIVHEKPSVLGETITVKVEIQKYKHHHLTLKLTAWDELGVIAEGDHLRTIVNDDWLMLKIKRQKAQLGLPRI